MLFRSLIFSSITTGQIISRAGRYKLIVVGGISLMTVGVYLLSNLRADTELPVFWAWMFVTGLGIGPTMSAFTLIVQNAVPIRQLGVATSNLTFFRQIGGSVGLAVLGTLFASSLRDQLPGQVKPIKLSSNEGALGPSPRALAAVQKAAESMHRYPDGGASELRAAIAKRFGLDAERIVCGAGSDELIALLCRAYAGPGDEVLYSQYGFVMYPIATYGVGATPVAAPETNFRTDVDALLAKANARTKICFVANPNIPTGTYITAAELKRLREGLPAHTLLVVDAADRKSTRLNSSHIPSSRMPSSA